MSDIWDYSGTPSANTSLEGTNVAPGMSPANVDDAIRILTAIVRNSLHVDLETFLKGTAALPVASGGTGATTAAAALAALGGLEDDFRDLQPISKTAAFAFADADRGKRINYQGAATVAATINANATTPITEGAVFVVRNSHLSAGSLLVSPAVGVSLLKNGAIASSAATLAPGGVASLIRWGVDEWTITGSGIS